MIAYWVHSIDPFAVQFGGGFGIRWYGIAYLVAFAAGYSIYLHLAKRGLSVIPADKVGDFITGCAVFGVLIGGRLGHMLFYNFAGLMRDPLVFFRVWEGGMSAHGGMFGVALYTLWYAWRHQVSWPGLGDNVVVGAALGLVFGRVANFINGELYGRPAMVPWAVKFPQEIYELPPEAQREILARAQQTLGGPVGLEQVVALAPESPDLRAAIADGLTPRHPSQLYEGILEGLLLFAILWFLRTRVRTANGAITGVFFVGYAILRSIGEMFRNPDYGYVGALTRGQFLSVFIFLLGIGFLVAAKLRPTYPPAES
ncbi:MAG: prolipoprotein diacylglyceryl transferase [Chthoniobacterales bacterium]|nr:prolipoprotein diacylglyceryl transferase [Chthoniobacterales bacterium]